MKTNVKILECNDVNIVPNIFITKMYSLKVNTVEISNNNQSHAGLSKRHDITFNQIRNLTRNSKVKKRYFQIFHEMKM